MTGILERQRSGGRGWPTVAEARESEPDTQPLRCGVCGFRPLGKSAPAQHRHLIAHDHWLHGVKLRGPDRFERVGEFLEFELLLTRPNSIPAIRRVAERATTLLIRDQLIDRGLDKPWREFPLSEWQPPALLTHAILLSTGTRIVGALLLEWRPLAGIHRWGSPPDQLEPAKPGVNDWCLSYAWLHRSVRRRHIGPAAAAVAATGVRRSPGDLLFLPPFTRKGESASRSVSPGRVRVAKPALPTNYTNLVYPFAPPLPATDGP